MEKDSLRDEEKKDDDVDWIALFEQILHQHKPTQQTKELQVDEADEKEEETEVKRDID
jgi:hypothetical protein